ncbi:hypothetical protein [Streptomyces hydrogenans]|uniref:Uncharacterized protein n=1 Tax=Streptomyces hydrogenans TaxID=1873719 RepID=A0ABQ3PJN9_9ACTN|nr:hypothetical protein [Streptomyces hydrogenans]GHG09836.1 hypothetical protein GCM10018784_23090 [Streptomyces hydrogenans]GHI25239.1 hypothetical protein Shyd_66100 [Streptomyces hydrogenans]
MAISFVGTASWDSAASSGSSFTLNKPASVTTGDFLVAVFAADTFDSGGGDRTVTNPSGWTTVGHVYGGANGFIHVMTRTATASEPSSWNGSFTGGGTADRAAIVCAYRGVAGLAVDGESSTGSAASFATASVSNPAATNWRVVAAAYSSASTSYAIASNEVALRDRQPNSNIEPGMWDSNGTVATGSTSRTVSRGAAWESAMSWIGILDNQEGAVASGSLAVDLPLLSAAGSGELSYSAAMAVSLLMPSMTGAGIASPPSGTLAVPVVVTVSVVGASAARGSLDVLVLPVVDVVGETRHFGIRTVTPEREERIVRPRLGATD